MGLAVVAELVHIWVVLFPVSFIIWPMDQHIGQVINNYEIQQLIGEGGMGVVYRAYHPEIQRFSAIKLMRRELVSEAGSYERFLQEARTASRLHHPNIVNVINFGQFQDTYYLMMDFIEGPNLRQLIQENSKGLPLSQIAQIFTQIADVLYYAHQEGVLHRDLKPDNILTTTSHDPDYDVQAIITDFGLVKIAHDSLTSTQEGVSLGTPAYMSPEQCRGVELDVRSDIFALGVMLYEAITGQRPYPIRNLFDAVKFHNSGKLVAPRAHVPSLPVPLNVLVRQMLTIDKSGRPASALEVADKLRPFVPKREGVVVAVPFIEHTGTKPADPTDPVREEPAGLPMTAPLEADEDKFTLMVTYHGQTEHVVNLPDGKEFLLGRQPECEVVLDRPERYVSKQHCVVKRQGTQILIKDVGSTNGTFMGLNKLTPDVFHPWPFETEINLGAFKLSIHQRKGSDPTQLLPVKTEIHTGHILVCPDGLPSRLPLKEQPIVVGRVPGCDMILNNVRVSKRHVQIERVEQGYKVTDLNSTNGTFLDLVKLTPHVPVIWSGREILRVGPFELKIVSN